MCPQIDGRIELDIGDDSYDEVEKAMALGWSVERKKRLPKVCS
jgi:uracil DNA glycosylase